MLANKAERIGRVVSRNLWAIVSVRHFDAQRSLNTVRHKYNISTATLLFGAIMYPHTICTPRLMARKRIPGPTAMIPSADTITVYLRSTHSEPAERAAIDALGHRFPRVVVIPSDSLSRNTSPVCDLVWALDGQAGVPSAARNFPLYQLEV